MKNPFLDVKERCAERLANLKARQEIIAVEITAAEQSLKLADEAVAAHEKLVPSKPSKAAKAAK